MTKIGALLLTAAMAVSMSACRNASPGLQPESSETPTTAAPTPLEILKTADQTWSDDMGMDADLTATLSVSSKGVTMEMGLEGNVKAVMVDEKPQLLLEMAVTVLGETAAFSAYIDSEYAYMSTPDGKQKTPIGGVESGENPFDEMGDIDLSDLEKLLLDSSVTEENGRRKLSFTISGSSLTDKVKELMNGKLGELGVSLPDSGIDALAVNMECSDILLTCEINSESYIETLAADIALIIKGEEASALDPTSKTEVSSKISMGFQMKMNNPGQKVTITPPADLDEYEEAPQIPEDPALYMEAYEAVLSQLYTDEGEPVKNYDEVYNRLCDKYGEEMVQSIIDTYVTPYLNAT